MTERYRVLPLDTRINGDAQIYDLTTGRPVCRAIGVDADSLRELVRMANLGVTAEAALGRIDDAVTVRR